MKRLFALLTVCALLLATMSTALAASSISLIKPENDCYGTWKRVSTKRYSFRFEIKNTSPTKTVRSYDVSYYTTDAYGDQSCALTTVTLNQKIKPYEKVYTGEIFLENAAAVCKVYVEVTGVRYTNGTSEYLDRSAQEYWSWTINEDDLVIDVYTYADELDAVSSSTTSSSSSSSTSSILDKLPIFGISTPTPRPTISIFNSLTSKKPMKIDPDGEVCFKLVSTKRISMRCDVRNNSSKTVRSYDVTYYTCDALGRQNALGKTVTLTQRIEPYQTALCPEIFLENQSQVYQVKAAVSYVRYTDGTSESILSPEYVTWNLSR